jgi:hypothetical protein
MVNSEQRLLVRAQAKAVCLEYYVLKSSRVVLAALSDAYASRYDLDL